MEKMGTLKKNGDQKTNFGPHGDQSPQMGTNVGAVPTHPYHIRIVLSVHTDSTDTRQTSLDGFSVLAFSSASHISININININQDIITDYMTKQHILNRYIDR